MVIFAPLQVVVGAVVISEPSGVETDRLEGERRLARLGSDGVHVSTTPTKVRRWSIHHDRSRLNYISLTCMASILLDRWFHREFRGSRERSSSQCPRRHCRCGDKSCQRQVSLHDHPCSRHEAALRRRWCEAASSFLAKSVVCASTSTSRVRHPPQDHSRVQEAASHITRTL